MAWIDSLANLFYKGGNPATPGINPIADYPAMRGLLDPSQEEKKRALSMAMLQAGAGILANNTGHYGAFGPPVGAGLGAGINSYQQFLNEQKALREKRMKAKLMFDAFNNAMSQETTPGQVTQKQTYKLGGDVYSDLDFAKQQADVNQFINEPTIPAKKIPMLGQEIKTIANPDGSYSTERTIGVELDGIHYVIPTIVNGKQLSSDEAIKAWQSGINKAVGAFSSQAEADRFAMNRSAKGGKFADINPAQAMPYLPLPANQSQERPMQNNIASIEDEMMRQQQHDELMRAEAALIPNSEIDSAYPVGDAGMWKYSYPIPQSGMTPSQPGIVPQSQMISETPGIPQMAQPRSTSIGSVPTGRPPTAMLPTTVFEHMPEVRGPDIKGREKFDLLLAANNLMKSGDIDLMAIGFKLRADLAEKENSQDTADIKTYKYIKSLPKDEQAEFTALMGGKSAGLPSDVAKYQFWKQLDEKGRAEFENILRAGRTVDSGSQIYLLSPTGQVVGAIPKGLPPQESPGVKGEQARAQAEAKLGVEQEGEAAKKGKMGDSIIYNISQARNILKKGAATGSVIGTGYAYGKRIFGVSDESTRANNQLKLIAGWMVSNVPRMEGPQSNYDVGVYREMAASVGDSTLPIEDRLSALDVLEALQRKYQGIQGGQQRQDIRSIPDD
jgi:hypothetical protein